MAATLLVERALKTPANQLVIKEYSVCSLREVVPIVKFVLARIDSYAKSDFDKGKSAAKTRERLASDVGLLTAALTVMNNEVISIESQLSEAQRDGDTERIHQIRTRSCGTRSYPETVATFQWFSPSDYEQPGLPAKKI